MSWMEVKMFKVNLNKWIRAAAVILALQVWVIEGNTSKIERPNIILVMADDQGWGDVGYYEHEILKTPELDAMSNNSIRFDRFYAAAPVCSPTRASVMTGRHPNRMGCFKWGWSLRPQEVTIAEALKKAGYTTGHFGKWHLGSVCKGSPVNPGASGFDKWLSAPNFFDNDPILSREGKAVQMQGESSMVTMDAALQFIKQNYNSSEPFFAVIWFGSPHKPHRASEKNARLYEDTDKKHFYGEIAGIDNAVGKLRSELRRLKIHNNTIVWYCSDNGGLPGFGVTGGRTHKGSVYEGGLRVPALLEWPVRIKKPFVTDMTCCTSDIYPTLLEIAGVELNEQPPIDGISLVPLINGDMDKRNKPIGFWDYTIGGISTPSRQWMSELLEAQNAGNEIADESRLRLDAAEISTQYPSNEFSGHSAWLEWPWKLHRIASKDGNIKFELYNLKNDPMERSNLVDKKPSVTSEMMRGLTTWLGSVVDSLNGKDY